MVTQCGHNHLVRLGEEGSIEFRLPQVINNHSNKMITVAKATKEVQEAIVVVCVVR